jgi:hypothetical protein
MRKRVKRRNASSTRCVGRDTVPSLSHFLSARFAYIWAGVKVLDALFLQVPDKPAQNVQDARNSISDILYNKLIAVSHADPINFAGLNRVALS